MRARMYYQWRVHQKLQSVYKKKAQQRSRARRWWLQCRLSRRPSSSRNTNMSRCRRFSPTSGRTSARSMWRPSSTMKTWHPCRPTTSFSRTCLARTWMRKRKMEMKRRGMGRQQLEMLSVPPPPQPVSLPRWRKKRVRVRLSASWMGRLQSTSSSWTGPDSSASPPSGFRRHYLTKCSDMKVKQAENKPQPKAVTQVGKKRKTDEAEELTRPNRNLTSKQRRAADRAQKVKKVGMRYYETHNVKNKNRKMPTVPSEGKKAKRLKR